MTVSLMILVVDDDRNSREGLKELLSDEGHTVKPCPVASSALEALETERYDVLLTDLVMPGMSGIELVRAARLHDPQLRCFVMTGHPVIEEPNLQWIEKPIDFDRLLVSLAT